MKFFKQNNNFMYDIIGDIHGYADKLITLLSKLGYDDSLGYLKHEERQAIFVGDFIDRGPKIREVLSIVKKMVDNDSALAVMGNHEFNFLCYNVEVSAGEYLRKHSEKNNKQVEQTLMQFQNHQSDLNYYLNWFRTLPVYIDLGNLRVIHACWDNECIKHIRQNENIIDFSDKFLIELFQNKYSHLFKAIDISLKGKEDQIPGGYYFEDKDGTKRFTNRAKWWYDPMECSYNEYYFENVYELNGSPIDLNMINYNGIYKTNDIPVFCGHYWLNDKVPTIQTQTVACVDYSVAKDNILSAYRWSGEKILRNENFVWV